MEIANVEDETRSQPKKKKTKKRKEKARLKTQVPIGKENRRNFCSQPRPTNR